MHAAIILYIGKSYTLSYVIEAVSNLKHVIIASNHAMALSLS